MVIKQVRNIIIDVQLSLHCHCYFQKACKRWSSLMLCTSKYENCFISMSILNFTLISPFFSLFFVLVSLYSPCNHMDELYAKEIFMLYVSPISLTFLLNYALLIDYLMKVKGGKLQDFWDACVVSLLSYRMVCAVFCALCAMLLT